MHKKMTEMEKGKILALRDVGLSSHSISQELGRNQSSISRFLKKFDDYGTIKRIHGSGRPKKISEGVALNILKINKENSKYSLRKIKRKILDQCHKEISHETIRGFLHSNRIYAYSPTKKPLLLKRHIESRFSVSKEWIMMSENEVEGIIFSDECKFNLFGSDGIHSVWRNSMDKYKTSNISNTVKYGGGSVMVWGCFSSKGIGKLVFIDTKMDAPLYVRILSENLILSAEMMGLSDFIFQQDNDPKHTSRLANDFFTRKNINLLSWPSQSPDMNPIENIWAYLKKKIVEKAPQTILQLKETILNEWNVISKEMAKKYAMSFRKRVLMLYRANGGHIKY